MTSAYNITLIPGDGIGPEVSNATKRVLEATGVRFNWDIMHAGIEVMEEYGTPLPEHVLESIRKNKIAIKGPVTTPVGSGFRSVNVALRKQLELYACVRPCKSYEGVPTLFKDIDIVIVRENTEDLYAGIEFEKGKPQTEEVIKFISEKSGANIREDSGISIKPISETGSRRIIKYAFEYAKNEGRKKVTAIHKANIMKFSDGLFLSVAREIAADYPDIEFEDRIVDNMT
ncbi:MAG: isocitrate/isopropylmalate family dehydrogenase, partial [Candidatus Neomarinimicrobiota bacterium]